MGIYYVRLNQSASNTDSLVGQSNVQPKENSQSDLSQVKKINCKDIADVKEKENCLVEFIKLLNSDSSLACEGLALEADKNTCRQAYIIKEAASSGDLNKCQAAASAAMSADCSAQASFSLAIQRRDKKYCEKIINQTDKENCLKVLTGMGIK